jgi:hypothetical protein
LIVPTRRNPSRGHWHRTVQWHGDPPTRSIACAKGPVSGARIAVVQSLQSQFRKDAGRSRCGSGLLVEYLNPLWGGGDVWKTSQRNRMPSRGMCLYEHNELVQKGLRPVALEQDEYIIRYIYSTVNMIGSAPPYIYIYFGNIWVPFDMSLLSLLAVYSRILHTNGVCCMRRHEQNHKLREGG